MPVGAAGSAETSANHRDILRATGLIGGATVGALFIGLVRMKFIAALVGPAGVGLLGVLNSLMTMGFGVIGMAIDTTGVRQLSAANGEPARQRIARKALWSFAAVLACLALLLFWLLRKQIASLAFGSLRYSLSIALLGVGVAIMIVGAVQLAAVQSQQRLGDLARIRLLGALVGGLASVAAVFALGADGIVLAVLAPPIAVMLVASIFHGTFRRLPGDAPVKVREMRAQWTMLASLGLTVTAAASVGSFTQIAVRSIITQKLGLDQAGLFQASFAISSLNLGLVLGAMVPDYYPRLSRADDRPEEINQILNGQVHVALVLAAPALLFMSAAAPLLLRLLYSTEFTGAALLLRLQLGADALRIAGWALGYVLLTRKMKLAYFMTELVHGIVFVPLTWILVAPSGVAAAGVAYLLGYVVSLGVAVAFCRSEGIMLTRRNLLGVTSLSLLLVVLAALSISYERAAMLLGATLFLLISMLSLRSLARIGPLPTLVQRLVARWR